MLKKQFCPKIPGQKEGPKSKKSSKRKRDFDTARLRPHEQRLENPSVWLMFSAAGKEDGQILFGDSGFNMALTDEGAFVPYTYAAETPAQRKFYFRCYPDSRATPVQSFLTVTGMHEEHMDEQEAVARYSQAPKIDFHLKRG